MLTLFISAFALGLLFNAAPGAVFAQTVRHGLRGGFKPAFAVQVGSLVGDASWAVLGLAGAGLLLQLEALRMPLGIAGAAYLAWLSWDSWRAARLEAAIDPLAGPTDTRAAMRSGALISLSNPQNLAFWGAMGSALASLGVQDPGMAEYSVFFAGFILASIAWCFICAALVARLERLHGRWARLTYRLCAAALLALALVTLRDTLETNRTPLLKEDTAWQR